MTQLNAFVGHSFTNADRAVIDAFLKFLDQVKDMGIGFTWESAEPAEPKELADKVMSLIREKNLFIGICTTKEAIIDPVRLSRSMFNRRIFKANEEHFAWKTSDWIIQEIGLAIGRGMDLILLVESGLRQPGGLQGNLEYIPFERNTPEKSFGKLLEMIRALLPKAKMVPMAEAATSAVSEEKAMADQKEDVEWLKPKENWRQFDYEMALFHMIQTENKEGEREITSAYLATKEGQISANRESWEALQENFRLVYGTGGNLSTLEKLAAKYRDNSNVQTHLAVAYGHYGEQEKAGQQFIIAAELTGDKNEKLKRIGNAVLAFVRAGRKERIAEFTKQMKDLAPEVEDGESILNRTLRQIKDIEDNKDLLFGLLERFLQLHPDDVKSRFALAHGYSEEDQNELSLFHYLKIPDRERGGGTWNNLGVQFDSCGLVSKSVDAYRKGEEFGETLAMSNLAHKLIGAGFVKEADEICKRALQITDYHKNIGHAIQRIKSVPEEEDDKQTVALDKAIPISEFYRDYGRAAAQSEILEQEGRWSSPDCELDVIIKEGSFSAVGEYEVKPSPLLMGMLGQPPPQPDKYRIRYGGEIYGCTIKGNVTREEIRKPSVIPTLLTEKKDETKVLMVASEDLSEIRVYEKGASKKGPRFYKLNRIN
jgi:hypothetical protein